MSDDNDPERLLGEVRDMLAKAAAKEEVRAKRARNAQGRMEARKEAHNLLTLIGSIVALITLVGYGGWWAFTHFVKPAANVPVKEASREHG